MKKNNKGSLTLKEAERFLKKQGFKEMPLYEYNRITKEIETAKKKKSKNKAI
ncbi:MAG: hypothetical protein KA369_17705 [Spirochaetes bacterium]|nr:hypothetical protein [Spirochaetota bacterium]